jgi:multidrug efflux system outer membrane protein
MNNPGLHRNWNMPCTNHPALRRRIRLAGLALEALLCLALLAGCAVGPDFKGVGVQVPEHWSGPAEPATRSPTSADNDLARWWTAFDDSALTSLMERAVRSNLDLMRAEARILQARAARGIAISGIGPTVDVTGSLQRSRSPGSSNSRTNGVVSNQYQAGFDAGWELDFFGGARRDIEAAGADLQAAMETRRDVLVTLTAEVARNYIDLRTSQQRIVIARQNFDAQQHSAELTRRRFQAGFVNGLDVANAEAQAAATAAGIPLLEAAARQSIHALGVLLGAEPAALVQELTPASAIPAALPSVPLGVPSDLLRRRPDIREAEAAVHASTARIGVAEADLFPRFTISGSIGLQAAEPGSLFNWANRLWSFGPSVSWPVFDTGRILSNIELQKAFRQEDVIAYQQTVLTALQEVENALIASAKEQEHRGALVDAVTANRKAVELATMLYTEGQVDFLNVLDAQRSLYSSEDALVQSTGTMSTNLVALYKALGGGWSDGTANPDTR